MSEIGNAEIIKILSLMGQFLDIKDANRFRVRAYERAVQILAGVTQKLSEMSAEELKTIPGIGSSMIAHIREIAENGTLGEFEKLKRQIPSGVLKLLEIQGMGPKRAKLLWETLKIDSLEHLKKAAQEGKLRELPGFGEKLEAKILKGIAFAQAAANRALLWDAKGAADELVKTVKSLPQVIQAVAAGSLRRGKETIGDLDILCTATDGAQVIERFTKLPQIERVLAAGETKAAVWLNSQIQCDLRVVAPDSFGAALLYFTGSKDHNITLREYALKLGYSINEYGLFKIKPGSETKELGKKIAGKTEEEIFKALGLDWIAPELRENRGEIEAARAGRLPKLIEYKDVKGDIHTHTRLSDGANTIEEMANAGFRMGWEWIFVGDHSQSVHVANGLSPKDLHRSIEETRQVNNKIKNIRVFRSMEVDILKNGALDYNDDDLGAIDAVVAGIHSNMNMSEQEMTERIVKAVQNRHVDILAHPSGRLINKRDVYQVNIEAILEACQKNKTAVEINGQPDRLDLFDFHAKRAKELGIPLVLTTDAHAAGQLAFMELAVITARRAWLEKGDVLNSLSAKELAEWLEIKI